MKSRMDPNKLLADMKKNCRRAPAKGDMSTKSAPAVTGDIDYIFANPALSIKTKAEQKISDFLSNEGIFQINLDITMNDYNIAFDE